jgi:hypothetical protein
MKRILKIIFLLFNLTLYSQIQVEIPKNLVETEIPKSNTDELRELKFSTNEFGVKIVSNKLNIEKVKGKYTTKLKIDDGTLIGINGGEWGGKLSFIPNTNKKDEIELKIGNIKFIFEFKDKIYFIEGLAHGIFNGGAIFELKKQGLNFSYEKLIELDDAPMAFTIYENKLLLATYQNFYVVENFKKELIFENTFWSGLYPNSITIINYENVYMGMRSGLVKLDLTNKKMTFYKYTE